MAAPEQRRIIFQHIDEAGYTNDLACYQRHGGYEVLKKAVTRKPEELIDEVKKSGLRGRGGAGFPCGVKWGLVDRKSGKPIYLIVNAHESEPGTFKDRYIMHQDPHQLIEGTIISCFANNVKQAYIYIRGEMPEGARILEKAIAEARAKNFVGPNILGTGYSCEIYVHRGAGAYICGEETGLIESLEGKRAWPRIKPPFPAVEGAFRKPTIVNNVETLACVTQIMRLGVDWFKSMGVPPDPKNPRDAGSYGPKLYCISGHVNKPCCVELPLGVTARELIDTHGGGVWKGRKPKAINPGGISMGFVDVNAPLKGEDGKTEYDIPLDFNGPGKVGCLGLGTAAITVVDDRTSMVDVLHNVCQFFSHESCGQCTPCREGTGWMLKITDRLRRGHGRREDLDILVDVADRMGIIPGTTICGLSDGAGWPVKTAIRKFRQEFEDAIKTGRKSVVKSLPLAAAH